MARSVFSAVCVAAFVGVTLLASGCSRVRGVMEPTGAQAPGTSRVDMMVVTTRSAQGAPRAELFTGERGPHASFVDVAVSLPPDANRKIGDVQWPESLPPDPYRDFATLRADPLTWRAAAGLFDARIARAPRRQALVFVHGFNNRFEEAVYRLAQIVHDSGSQAEPVLFTWPSRGKLLAYGYDHESASFSRDALEELLQGLARDPSVGEISILAHSMGNWVTMEALRQMAIRNRGLSHKIANVMLAAPDVDFDVFQHQVEQIGSASSRFVVFVSRNDQALAVSRRMWGDKPRVGAVDKDTEPFHSDFVRERITVVDITKFDSDDPLHHGTFAASPDVVKQIGGLLAGGQNFNEGAGVGEKVGAAAEGAVGAVGSVAGAAVSAPFAVVDPRTRENFADHLEEAGSRLGDAAQNGASTFYGR